MKWETKTQKQLLATIWKVDLKFDYISNTYNQQTNILNNNY